MSIFSSRMTSDEKHWIIETELPKEIYESADFNFKSSYHVLCARVLGLSYIEYLHYCYNFGAKIVGRQGYSYPVWKIDDKAGIKEVLRELNYQWNKVESFLKKKDR